MAAGQQKRRLSAVNLASCNLPEQNREKKENLGLPAPVLRLNPHISLEWKEKQKRAVARKDQIGISWRELSTFIDAAYQSHSLASLADVLTVPQEIFELENLQGLLSYEAWKICLSESERKLLSQFLPKGTDVHQIIKPLLNGENLHFGNHFLEWSSLVCSGNAHPDVVIQREKRFISDKKAYYSELQKYHKDMLEGLQVLMERWINCKDPGNSQKILRRKTADNSFLSHPHDSQLNLKDNVGVSSVSWSSTGAEEHDVSDTSPDDSQERLLERQGGRSITISANKKLDDNLSEEDRWVKTSFDSSTADTHASYSKTSMEHQTVKKVKQTSGLVMFKSLNRVLGDTEKLEEEKKKLHNHWWKIACTEIAAAYSSREERHLQISQLMTSLAQEIAEKFRLIIKKEEEESEDGIIEDQENTSDDGDSDGAIQDYDQENIFPCSGIQALERIPSLNSKYEPDITSESLKNIGNSNEMEVENNESSLQFAHHQPLTRIPSLNSHEPELACEEPVEGVKNSVGILTEYSKRNVVGSSAMCMTSEQNCEEPYIAYALTEFLKNAKSNEDMVQERDAAGDVWSTMHTEGTTCYGGGQDYADVNKLLTRHHQAIEKQPTRMINLEENILKDEDKEILCKPDNDVGSSMKLDTGPSLFDAYDDAEKSRLLSEPPLPQVQQSYALHGHVDGMKQQELNFFMTSSRKSEGFHYSQDLQQQQQQMLKQREVQEKNLYALHLMQKNIYEYADKQPRHEVYTAPASSMDWETSSIRMLPIQSSATGDVSDHHWQNGTHSNWSSLEIPMSSQRQCPDDGNCGGGSLFGFLPHWNGLSHIPYDAASSDEYVPSAYAGGAASGGNRIQCEGHNAQFGYNNQHFNYMNPRDGNNQNKANGGITWINMPLASGVNSELMYQNSVMHDSMGKPFLGSWKQ